MALWTINDDDMPCDQEIAVLLRPLWERTRHPGIVEGRRAEALERHGGFAPLRRAEVSFEDTIDRDATLAWFASFSVVGSLPDAERAALLERMAEILDRHGVTEVHRRWRVALWATRRLG